MKKLVKKLKKLNFLSNIPDLLLIAGFSSAMYGFYLIYLPAMWIIGGAALVFLGYPRKGAD